jgi:release factor glutamine methyltransferase
VGDAVDSAARRLERAGVPQARREAAAVLAWVLGTDRGGVVARRPDRLSPEHAAAYEALVVRRERREPFAYLAGRHEFRGLVLRVDRRVLVPRPETELVVDAVLDLDLGARARVLDVGTGSGCIAVSLAKERPGWSVVALDRSGDALEVATDNAARHGVDRRIELLREDLGGLARLGAGAFDAVVSNPPYVSEAEWAGLEPEVREHEPREALVPGPTGLEAYQALAPAAFAVLRPGGWLVLELGYRSRDGAGEAVSRAGFVGVEVRPDLREIPRVLIAWRPGVPRAGVEA